MNSSSNGVLESRLGNVEARKGWHDDFSTNSPRTSNSVEKPSAKGDAEPAEPPRKPGRPPALDDYGRGKLVVALGIGLSLREAGAWVGCDASTISLMLKRDPRLAEDVEFYRNTARLHPFLNVYAEAGKNWKASAWLLEYLDKRSGKMTVDNLMSLLLYHWGFSRDEAPPEAFLRTDCCLTPQRAREISKA